MFAERKEAISSKITEFKNHSKDLKKKIIIAGFLHGVTIAVAWVAIPAFILGETELAQKWLPLFLNPELQLGLSVVAENASSGVLLPNQDRRLLKNPKIGTSEDFWATAAYYGLERVKSLKEEKEKRSMLAVLGMTSLSLTWVIPRELAFLSAAMLSENNMRSAAMIKSTQTVFNLSQAGATEIVLRTIGRDKKLEKIVEEEPKESRFASARRAVRAAASTVLFSSTHLPK